MSVLIDTNSLAVRSVVSLKQQQQQQTLFVVPQVLYEFWVAATRPLENNGLAFSVASARRELEHIHRRFAFLNDPPELYATWAESVVAHQALGKPAQPCSPRRGDERALDRHAADLQSRRFREIQRHHDPLARGSRGLIDGRPGTL
jgi:hypothetical protein